MLDFLFFIYFISIGINNSTIIVVKTFCQKCKCFFCKKKCEQWKEEVDNCSKVLCFYSNERL